MKKRGNMNCWNCKGTQTVQGYQEVTIDNRHNRTTKQWCSKCLSEYANTNVKYSGKHMPRLRDTNIKEYLEVIENYDFIPYADKWKTSSYYHYERLETIKK
jgi:hypothetical protein